MREKGAAFDGMKRGPSHSRFEPEEVRKAATKIQRWYRGVCAMYAAFGPMMFSRKDGRMSDFGTVSFLSGTSAAKWIRISDTTSVGALAHFMEKFWRLPRPDVLISVTGSAASLQLTSTLQRVFDRGLATAAAMTNAWIFTGGTDSGVMKLVGDAIHKYGLDVPLVGIMPWGAVQNRRTLHGAKGDVIPYHTKASSSLLEGKLNPHHTHQILVDAVREYGEGDVAWGHEIHMRSQLERVYAQAKGVPVVLLVVQGGPQTLAMMASSARQGSPLLVLSDSGGAATALWQYCEGGIARVSDPAFVELAEKLDELRSLDAARDGSLISFFSLGDDDTEESMSTALLRCLFRNLMFYQYSIHGSELDPTAGADSRARVRTYSSLPGSSAAEAASLSRSKSHASGTGRGGGGGGGAGGSGGGSGGGSITQLVKQARDARRGRSNHMLRALLLAVKWNQVDFARRMLLELPTFEDYSRPLDKMLQHALELQRVEIVDLLLDRPGCSVQSLSLCQLYLQEDPYSFLRSDAALQGRLQRRLSDGTIARSVTPKDMHSVYRDVVGPFLCEVCPLLSSFIESSSEGAHADLFFWSVLMGQPRLAKVLWAHVDNPLHCALLASHVCQSMKDQITWGASEVADHAKEYEGWALSVMEMVDEQEIAHLILSGHVERWRMGSLCEIALQMHVKKFLAHRHCTSLMDLWWRGGYPGSGCVIAPDENFLTCLLHLLLPFLNPYLRRGTKDGGALDRSSWRSREEREAELFDALGSAMRHGHHARQGAMSSPPLSTLARVPTKGTPLQRRASSVGFAVTPTSSALGGSASSLAAASDEAAALAARAGGGSGAIDSLLGSATVHLPVESTADVPRVTQQLARRRESLARTHSVRMPSLVHKMAASRAEQKSMRNACGVVADYYSVPLVKYLIRVTSQLVFLALYTQVLTHLATANQLEAMAAYGTYVPPLSRWEQIFVVWSLSVVYAHRRRQTRLSYFGMNKSRLPFQSIVAIGHLTLVLAIAFRLLSLLPTWMGWWGSGGKAEEESEAPMRAAVHLCYIVHATLLSLDAVLMCVELFTFMWTSLAFGVLAIIMGQMLVDLSLFLVFAVVFICGFSAALLGLSETAVHPTRNGMAGLGGMGSDMGGGAGGGIYGRMLRGGSGVGCEGEAPIPLVAVPVWAMFTDLELPMISDVPFALPLMLAFVLLANVVLVNLLIAMFADTYSRIKKNAETEYHYQRFLHIFEHIHVVETVPPPLSAPWFILEVAFELGTLIGLCHSPSKGRGEGAGGGGGAGGAMMSEALHRVAAARPMLGQLARTQRSVSNKYVQEFLKGGAQVNERTPAGMLRKVEGLIGTLDERVEAQLKKLEVQLGLGGGTRAPNVPHSDDELRATVAHVARLLERVTSELGPTRTSGQSMFPGLFGTARAAGSRDAATAAAPVTRPF